MSPGSVAVLPLLLRPLGRLGQALGLALGRRRLLLGRDALFLGLQLLQLGGLLGFGRRPFGLGGVLPGLLLLLRLGFLRPRLAFAAALLGFALVLLRFAPRLGGGLLGGFADPRLPLLGLALPRLCPLAQAGGAFALLGRLRVGAPEGAEGDVEGRPRQLQRRVEDRLGDRRQRHQLFSWSIAAAASSARSASRSSPAASAFAAPASAAASRRLAAARSSPASRSRSAAAFSTWARLAASRSSSERLRSASSSAVISAASRSVWWRSAWTSARSVSISASRSRRSASACLAAASAWASAWTSCSLPSRWRSSRPRAAPANCFALPTTLPSGPAAIFSCSLNSSPLRSGFPLQVPDLRRPNRTEVTLRVTSVAKDRGDAFGLSQRSGKLVAHHRDPGAARQRRPDQRLCLGAMAAVEDEVVDAALRQRPLGIPEAGGAATATLRLFQSPRHHRPVALGVEALDRRGGELGEPALRRRAQVQLLADLEGHLRRAEARFEVLDLPGGAEGDRLPQAVRFEPAGGEAAALGEKALAVVVEPFVELVVAGGADPLGAGRVAGAVGLALAPVEAGDAELPVLQILQRPFGAAEEPHPLGGEKDDPAGAVVAAEGEQRRHHRLGAELDTGTRRRGRRGAEPALGAALLGDLDESRFAARRRPQVAVFEALEQPFGGRPQSHPALVLGFALGVQDRVEAVAQLGPPGATAVGGVEAQVDGEDAERRPPFAQAAGVLQGRLRHRLASSSIGFDPATPPRASEKRHRPRTASDSPPGR